MNLKVYRSDKCFESIKMGKSKYKMNSNIQIIVICALFFVSKTVCKPAPAAAVASVIHGTENDKYCAKTEGEKDKQLKSEERDDLFEGDVIMTAKLAKTIKEMNETKQRDVISLPNMKWKTPNIPYMFDASISDRTKEVVKSACADYEKYTCIKCVPRTTETDYIRFFVGKGCWSYVGRQGGKQDLSLGSGCDFKGTVLHEMLHALGFFHEHTRLDRDDYVTIQFDAVKQGAEVNFKKYAVGMAEYFDEPYDYNSIMHYPANAFSKDTRDTIIVKASSASSSIKIGQREGLSDIDIKQIKKAYKCSNDAAPAPGKISATTLIPPAKATAATTKPTTAGPPSTPKQGLSTTNIPKSTGAVLTTPSPLGSTQPATTNAPVQPTVIVPTQQTVQPTIGGPVTTPIAVNLGGQKLLVKITAGVSSQGTYPTWPTDFNWNTNGMPQQCNCQTCQCRCVHVNEPSAGVEWKNNYLCYKRGLSKPGIEWSSNGPVKGKRCTHVSDPTFGKYWNDNFLCVPKDSSYHFAWSSKGPLNQDKFTCLRMDIPAGPKEWQDNYLCAIKTKQTA